MYNVHAICICRAPWVDIVPEAISTVVIVQLHNVFNGTEGPVPLPEGLDVDATDFLRGCLVKDPKERASLESLLVHPFLEGAEDTVAPFTTGDLSLPLKGASLSAINVSTSEDLAR